MPVPRVPEGGRVPLILAACLALLVIGPAWAAADFREPERELTLLSVKRGPTEGSFVLNCPGLSHHGLTVGDGGRLVTLQLPGVRSAVSAEALPAPGGPVGSIGLGSGPEGVRIVFALTGPSTAYISTVDSGLELRMERERVRRSSGSSEGMTLGPEDLLEINVFDVDELNRTVRIAESGTVSLPLVGDVIAAGLTPRQFEDQVSRRLEDLFLTDPQVSVFVKEHGSKRVSVLGAVGSPGVYEMVGPRTILQMLARAGGLTDAAGENLYLVRVAADGSGERIAISVDDLVMSRDPALNVPVLPGDVISVPVDPKIHVYVDGAVNTPGRIEQPTRRAITLLQAISKAGGATERANLKKVTILRQSGGSVQISLVANVARIRKGKEIDPVLADGDMIVVHETFF